MKNIDYVFDSHNADYIEGLYQEFLEHPESLPDHWRSYFEELRKQSDGNGRVKGRAKAPKRGVVGQPAAMANDRQIDLARLQDRVDQLIRGYRVRGHLVAKLDPLGLPRPERPELALKAYRLSEADLDRPFSTTSIGGPATQTLRDIVERLRNAYCRFIGVQFMHIDDPVVRNWLCQRIEETENRPNLSRDEQLRILTRLTDAVVFEQFVRKKYVGAKTFSLEGAESLIPLLDLAIEKAARQGVAEIVMGMAHRGRLNVLANIIGKKPREIFWEFEDPNPELQWGAGDVKYHLGFSGDWRSANGSNVHLSLCFNPSHLEFVNPVAVGRMRAKQDRAADVERRKGMVLLIHGDAAFAGEGVIQETLNLSQLAGYHTGGTLHVIVNNQIGFTTPPEEARSTTYATDVAKMLQIPIFHVNGEHPEAVAHVVDLALEFRKQFRRDVVIDMYCYRRWGHNESDEPTFTQPVLYHAIEKRPSVRDGYLKHLLELGGITREEADRIAEQRRKHLEKEFDESRQAGFVPSEHSLTGIWQGYRGGAEPKDDEPETAVAKDVLQSLLEKVTRMPADFHVHPKLERHIERRRKMAAGEEPLDWSAAEAVALATLVVEGHPIRITGQDTERGTFSQRHAVLHDLEDGHKYNILQDLSHKQQRAEIINAPLCEAGDLGFQYGYSLDCPEAFVAWEAQFGDFCNAAQVIIDQFITSAEDKWKRLSGITLLLPHSFEGQGPEHSSARLERFLSLAGEHNIQIAYPTTPAQYFHLLRRQVIRRWRKPLILLTPKSLLRHRRVVSKLEELAGGRFQKVMAHQSQSQSQSKTDEIRRVLMCTGKIYYDLLEACEQQQRNDIAIVRIEQLYPIPEEEMKAALQNYRDEVPVYWVQEEPENMGAWYFWRARYCDRLFGRFPFNGITRAESASPATGSSTAHKREHEQLVSRALKID